MKDRYSLPTGKLRGARLGFSGDVVSNHSILLELERRGATTVLTESEEQEAVDAALRDLFLHNVQHLHDVVTETQCSLQILGSAHVHQHNTFASVLSTILTLLKRCSKAFQESELPANTGHDVADYELGTCSNKTQTMRRITALAMSLSWEAKQHQELLGELERKADRSVPFLRRADWVAAHSLYYALEEASAILRGRKAVYMTSEEAQQDAKEQDVRDTVLRAEATATTAQRLSETRRKSLLRSMSNVAQAAVRLGSKRNLLDTVVPEAMDIEATSSSTPRTQAAASTATMSASHTPNHTSTPTGLHRILALRARPASGASSASPSKLRRSLRRPEESPAETKQLPNSETKQGANSETKELPNSERKLAPSSEKKLLPASEKRFRSSASARLTPSSLPRADPGPASGEAASHDSPADFVPTRLRFPRLQKGLAACSMDGLLPNAKRSSTFLTDGASAKDKTRHELVRHSDPGTDLSASGAGEGTFGERRKRQAPARLRIQG